MDAPSNGAYVAQWFGMAVYLPTSSASSASVGATTPGILQMSGVYGTLSSVTEVSRRPTGRTALSMRWRAGDSINCRVSET